MSNKTAVTLHFLVEGFWRHTERYNDKNILETIPMGRNFFVFQSYKIAEEIEAVNLSLNENWLYKSSYHYEAVGDRAARCLFNYIKTHQCMPDPKTFMEDFKPNLELWYKNG